MKISLNKKGSVLILALWTTAFLVVLAVQVGMRVRQRASLLSRIESNSQLRFLASSGLNKAIAVLRKDLQKNGPIFSAESKMSWHNNPGDFKDIKLVNGSVDVMYSVSSEDDFPKKTYYGFVDEESKINLNTADISMLKRLIEEVALLNENDSLKLAEAIIDWRMPGRSKPTGFYSDDFYYTLESPYLPKDAPFERIEELLLLPDMTKETYERLHPFVTVYGDGRVNVNTAPRQVLAALGLYESLITKILSVRRGEDGREYTEDDYVFKKSYDLTVELLKFLQLAVDEIKQIDAINGKGILKTNSAFYYMASSAKIDGNKRKYTSACVYDAHSHLIKYWTEK